jgi:hypothetical protein
LTSPCKTTHSQPPPAPYLRPGMIRALFPVRMCLPSQFLSPCDTPLRPNTHNLPRTMANLPTTGAVIVPAENVEAVEVLLKPNKDADLDLLVSRLNRSCALLLVLLVLCLGSTNPNPNPNQVRRAARTFRPARGLSRGNVRLPRRGQRLVLAARS